MKQKLIKLINVKSIVTIVLTVIFGYMSITEKIDGQQFLTVFTTVIAFYFGTQHEKYSSKKEDE